MFLAFMDSVSMSRALIIAIAKTTVAYNQTRNRDLVGGRADKGGDRVAINWSFIVKFRKYPSASEKNDGCGFCSDRLSATLSEGQNPYRIFGTKELQVCKSLAIKQASLRSLIRSGASSLGPLALERGGQPRQN